MPPLSLWGRALASSRIVAHKCNSFPLLRPTWSVWRAHSTDASTSTQASAARVAGRSSSVPKKAGGKSGGGPQNSQRARPQVLRRKNGQKVDEALRGDDQSLAQGQSLPCLAFTTAERYNLPRLLPVLNTRYAITPFQPDEGGSQTAATTTRKVIHAKLSRVLPLESSTSTRDATETAVPKLGTAKHEGEIFIFDQGTVVCWNVPHDEITALKTLLRHAEEEPYDAGVADRHAEDMQYVVARYKSDVRASRLVFDERADEMTHTMEKFAFSNGLALSVKLSVWEAMLDDYTAAMQEIPKTLKEGRTLRLSRQEVLKRTGELLFLRYNINLVSDFLSPSDFYWNRPRLEDLYTRINRSLDVKLRANVINSKLNHCQELAGLLRTHLSEAHGTKLEWAIIALISVEVLFEMLHLMR